MLFQSNGWLCTIGCRCIIQLLSMMMLRTHNLLTFASQTKCDTLQVGQLPASLLQRVVLEETVRSLHELNVSI